MSAARAVPSAEIGVIGGSGFYSFFQDAEEVVVETPWGPPSDPLHIGQVAGRAVAFIPRHGRDHRYPPHRVPYRANVWAMRSVGVQQVLGPCAVGGLRPELGPGTIVVPDQFVDRTAGRAQTFYDSGALHVSMADPYCPDGRTAAVSAARAADWSPVDGGTLVVIDGPRFSTRAESRWFAHNGWAVVGMTGHPEAVLARELAMCFTAIALVTDLDAGVEQGEGVTHAEVLQAFAGNIDRLRAMLVDAIAALPVERTCPCAAALDGLTPPIALP
ncbi:MAG: S-methyl-5'-thioadenosine phosphorylase [Candidatus Nanopelagicales bacterium]